MENVVNQTKHASRFVMMKEKQESKMKLILEYIQNGVSQEDQKERRKSQRRATKICILDNNLYKREFTEPFMKCLRMVEVDYVMAEIYE